MDENINNENINNENTFIINDSNDLFRIFMQRFSQQMNTQNT